MNLVRTVAPLSTIAFYPTSLITLGGINVPEHKIVAWVYRMSVFYVSSVIS